MGEHKKPLEEAMDALLSRRSPIAPAWVSRTHMELVRLYPQTYIFRLGDDLDSVIRWMQETGVVATEECLQPLIGFDDDRKGARVTWEGGCLTFQWQGVEYRLISVFVNFVFAWLICPDQKSGEALVEAVARHNRGRRASVMVFEGSYWDEAPSLEASLEGYSWGSVVLPESTRTSIQRAAELFFSSGSVYEDLGIPWKLGFLLVGPPGTGKTLTTKILARTCGVPFLYVRSLERDPDSDTIRSLFQGARDRAPCILCLEDVDSLVREDLRSTFLNEMDGLEEDYRGVLTVATTNHPERLDAALLHRPSRFDYRFEFPLPDDGQRRAFIHLWTGKLAKLGYVDQPERATDEIVRRSQGMSHAYLKRVLVGTVMRMHTLEQRGDEAFARLALEELADAVEDRSVGRRAETMNPDGITGSRVGFRFD